MKIALILGRGVEGAGVTRYMIEICNFLKKIDIEHDVFVVDDKKWGRGESQDMPSYKSITEKNISGFADYFNSKFDYVFINSVPSIKHSQWAIDGFLDMVKNITTKKIIFQNDHKIASIHRNANFIELCKYCDGIVSHSITSPFYKKLVEEFGSEVRSKFIQLQVGFNFSQLEKYRKEDHVKKITYLGRYATFKQPDRLFGFLPYARQNNLLLEMKGVERSLGALNIFYDDIDNKIPKANIYEATNKAIEDGLVVDNDKRDFEHIYVFGPYDYVDGMETLSNSLVGADFYTLEKTAFGDNFEYAQCEIVGVGCIPMFDYVWAENVYIYDSKGNKTDKRFIDLPEYGLFVKKDLSNVVEIVEKINDIYSNKTLHKRYIDCGYEITKAHCDSNWIFQKLLDNISKIEKTKIIKAKSLF
jgi:glycosyltransferase involved in cell wall biosynthesis